MISELIIILDRWYILLPVGMIILSIFILITKWVEDKTTSIPSSYGNLWLERPFVEWLGFISILIIVIGLIVTLFLKRHSRFSLVMARLIYIGVFWLIIQTVGALFSYLKLLKHRKMADEKPKIELVELSDEEKSFIDKCLTQKYKEEEESRAWHSDTNFLKVLDPLNDGKYNEVCEEAKKILTKVNDFHGIYYWWGSALLKIGDFDQARKVLLTGLEKSKSKFPICEMMGRVEWKAGNAKEAVHWWSQAILGQESIKNYADESAFLHMAYVAQGLDLYDASQVLFSRVDLARAPTRLLENDASSIRDLVLPVRSLITVLIYQLVRTRIKTDSEEKFSLLK